MQMGRLYKSAEEQFVTNVNYRLIGQTSRNICGELVPTECVGIADGGDYTVELADNRKITCNLKKNVNLRVIGLPPRFVYRFVGS